MAVVWYEESWLQFLQKSDTDLVEELITFLSFFGPQKLGILTARLNKKSLNINF